MSKYCTYRSTHSSGFFYEGKGVTEKVRTGKYKGSGVKFNLALTWPGFGWDTWTTVILETFDTEEAAYAAEEKLVPVESLANPFRLNMVAGGQRGKYKNHSQLLKSIRSAEKKEKTALARIKAAQKKSEQRAKTLRLKQQLKALAK